MCVELELLSTLYRRNIFAAVKCDSCRKNIDETVWDEVNIRKIPLFNGLLKNGIFSHRRLSRLDIEANIFDIQRKGCIHIIIGYWAKNEIIGFPGVFSSPIVRHIIQLILIRPIKMQNRTLGKCTGRIDFIYADTFCPFLAPARHLVRETDCLALFVVVQKRNQKSKNRFCWINFGSDRFGISSPPFLFLRSPFSVLCPSISYNIALFL